ncbi:DUF2169 family type VI secretion system accessory protein [Jannaschia seohaensis]|uniref:DUF2169 domain-containing protein n=1 Tax=Jannaschia seohaensis TaxID=475081 RepID=A0A2Y9AX12_9RHOB|nr:DUF2169 domain-containing protein [Jannaschia seohaensis]PWJ16574.1 hypothetical protein BCF38_10888 [Jannaschia seohaensis]SSA48811.1 hypothetical protein SAMN05421539_10888 [Jannaschia seohaensis]
MEIFNQTRFVHQHTGALDKAGREYLLLVVKGTFDFGTDGASAQLSAEQRPLVFADEYKGEPGFSAPLWETDFAHRKPRCDVIVNGDAHAPNGRPATSVRVGVRVGDWIKQFDVVGAREWRAFGPVVAPTKPMPFTRMAFGYDTAFGGRDPDDPDDEIAPTYMDNPVGMGWARATSLERVSGRPVPNTQAVDDPVATPFGDYTPMSLGPIPRNVPARSRYAGTYDQAWIDDVFPFLPADFDERYFQSAPADQWIDPPPSGTPVVILGLTPSGRESFRLPSTELPVRLFRGRETALDTKLRADTILFDCHARQVSLVWRVDIPIRRKFIEISEAWIGPPTEAMLRARAEGRRYIRAVATGGPEEDAP